MYDHAVRFPEGPTGRLNFEKAVTLSLVQRNTGRHHWREDAQVPGVGSLLRQISAMMRRCPSWNRIWAAKAFLDEGYLDVDGTAAGDAGRPMDILVSQNSSTPRDLPAIAEVIVQNLDAIGVKAHGRAERTMRI